MSLKAFHLVFISASVALALFFAAWCLGVVPGRSSETNVLAGGGALATAMGLVAYEAWFVRKMRRLR